MNFLKSLFSKQEDKIETYQDFWTWFERNERVFFHVVKNQGNIEKVFFEKLSDKLNELGDGFFFLTGMPDNDTVELIITADGEVKNIVFAEELINAAPLTKGWKFTALKSPMPANDFSISMAGLEFSTDNIHFYSNDLTQYPDEIDITVVHDELNEANKSDIINGTYIFLDNYLGELTFATTIDNLTVIGKDEVESELIPIEKLSSYLIWRQKEFIEKYEGIRHDTENDSYGSFSANLDNGNKLLAIINTDVVKWDSKASHPWILTIEIKYDAVDSEGMPDETIYELLQEIEDELLLELRDIDGYINIGRQTADGLRQIYFACKDFRMPSKVVVQMQSKYSRIPISYNIYKDKYWQSFERFNNN
jgi:hypothetical protein